MYSQLGAAPGQYSQSGASPTGAAGGESPRGRRVAKNERRIRWKPVTGIQFPTRYSKQLLAARTLPAMFRQGKADESYTALMMEDWIKSYVSERKAYVSPVLFCQVKCQELMELTEGVRKPNDVRTAVCLDLLQTITQSVKGDRLRELLGELTEVLVRGIYKQGPTQSNPSVTDYLSCVSWNSSCKQTAAAILALRDQVNGLKLPARLFAMRRVAATMATRMIGQERLALMAWVFFEWRSWAEYRRQTRPRTRILKVVNSMVAKRNLPLLRNVMRAWRTEALGTRIKKLHSEDLEEAVDCKQLTRKADQMWAEAQAFSDRISRLKDKIENEKYRLRMAEEKRDEKKKELNVAISHQEACEKISKAITGCLYACIGSIEKQVDRLEDVDLSSFQELLLHNNRTIVSTKNYVQDEEKKRLSQLAEFLGNYEHRGSVAYNKTIFKKKTKTMAEGNMIGIDAGIVLRNWCNAQLRAWQDACDDDIRSGVYDEINGPSPDDLKPFENLAEMKQSHNRQRLFHALTHRPVAHKRALKALETFADLKDFDGMAAIRAALSLLMQYDSHFYDTLRVPDGEKWTDHEEEALELMHNALEDVEYEEGEEPVEPLTTKVIEGLSRAIQLGSTKLWEALERHTQSNFSMDKVSDLVFEAGLTELQDQIYSRKKKNTSAKLGFKLNPRRFEDLAALKQIGMQDKKLIEGVFEKASVEMHKIFKHYVIGLNHGVKVDDIGDDDDLDDDKLLLGWEGFRTFAQDCSLIKAGDTAMLDSLRDIFNKVCGVEAPPSQPESRAEKREGEGEQPTTQSSEAPAGPQSSPLHKSRPGSQSMRRNSQTIAHRSSLVVPTDDEPSARGALSVAPDVLAARASFQRYSMASPSASRRESKRTSIKDDELQQGEQEEEEEEEGEKVGLTFSQLREAVLRLAIVKFPRENSPSRSLSELLYTFVLPNANAASSTLSYTQAVGAEPVQEVFAKYRRLLRTLFQGCVKQSKDSHTITWAIFIKFLDTHGLLKVHITQHEANALFEDVQNAVKEEGDMVRRNDMFKSKKVKAISEEDQDSWSKLRHKIHFHHFLLFLLGVSHFVVRHPYVRLEDRLEGMIERHFINKS